MEKVFGIAVQEPVSDIDDIAAASNPALLAQLTTYMKQAKFDLREFQRVLFHTAAYQRLASKPPEDPTTYRFPGPVIRRMSAEQVWDSIIALTTGSEADNILLRRGDDLQKTDIPDNKITAEAVRAVIDEMKQSRTMIRGGGKKIKAAAPGSQRSMKEARPPIAMDCSSHGPARSSSPRRKIISCASSDKAIVWYPIRIPWTAACPNCSNS